MRQGEIACNKKFLLFSQCFLPYMVLIFHFKCTLKCRLQFVSVWTSLKFCRLVMGLVKVMEYSCCTCMFVLIKRNLWSDGKDANRICSISESILEFKRVL